MGYACPVCETPQADGRHLANHLAFTALIHGDDHEAWLDEHVPNWAEAGERELAGRVIEFAAETTFPQNVENAGDESQEATGGQGHDHGDGHDHAGEHDHGSGHGHGDSRSHRGRGQPVVDPDSAAVDPAIGDVGGGDEDERDVAAVLAEARELTERMRNGDDPNGNDRTDNEDEDSDRGESENEQ